MRRFLILCCLALAAALVYQWTHPVQPMAGHGQAPADSAATTVAAARTRLIFPPVEDFQEITERPLFSATRRPRSDTTETAAQRRAATVLANKASLDSYVLSGVYFNPDETLALFWDRRKKEVVRARIGDPLADWQIKSVEPQRVIVSRGSEEQALPLERGRGLIPAQPPTRRVPTGQPATRDRPDARAGAPGPAKDATKNAESRELLEQLKATMDESAGGDGDGSAEPDEEQVVEENVEAVQEEMEELETLEEQDAADAAPAEEQG